MACDITPELSTIPSGTPGSNGAAGTNGTNGTNGVSAFTTLTASFVQPAINATVSATVGNTSWMANGLPLYIEDGGFYDVVSITNATTVVIRNLGYNANATPTDTVPSGGKVVPSGLKGTDGSGSGDLWASGITTETELGSLSMTVADVGTLKLFRNSDQGSVLQGWVLVSSTAATVAGETRRVFDYATTTKELVWLKVL